MVQSPSSTLCGIPRGGDARQQSVAGSQDHVAIRQPRCCAQKKPLEGERVASTAAIRCRVGHPTEGKVIGRSESQGKSILIKMD